MVPRRAHATLYAHANARPECLLLWSQGVPEQRRPRERARAGQAAKFTPLRGLEQEWHQIFASVRKFDVRAPATTWNPSGTAP